MKLVDMKDLKSFAVKRAGSTPAPGTNNKNNRHAKGRI